MANTDPLAPLKDIHLPPAIGWWPLAPGWYMLLALLLFLIIILVYFIYKKRQHALAKKQALLLLRCYLQEYEKEQNVPQTSAQISELLRRVALVYYPRSDVASLRGDEWLNFLNRTGKGVDFQQIKAMLLDAPFKTQDSIDLEPLFKNAEIWIKQRRRPCSN